MALSSEKLKGKQDKRLRFGKFLIPIVRFGGISGEFGRSMARPSDLATLICCRSLPKKVHLGIYRIKFGQITMASLP